MANFVESFYDELSPFYRLIYPDWNASVERQGIQLASLIREHFGEDTTRVLDVSCGIGTQALGLATQGFDVVASDLSANAVARAQHEAELRNLSIPFSVCDMRYVETHHPSAFDVVLSADNSIPHLLSDEAILQALRGFYSRLRGGGGCVITVRDYDQIERGKDIVKLYGIRTRDDIRYLIWQVWDFEGDHYDLSMYFVEDDGDNSEAKTHIMRSRYYAISTNKLLQLMGEAGFVDLARLDNVFFQPVLVGQKASW